MKTSEKELKANLDQARFGRWRFDPEQSTLSCRAGLSDHQYYIPLAQLTNSAQILDWLCQIQSKRWASPEIVWDLIEAIVFLIDPQSHICCGGVEPLTTMEEKTDV